MMGGRGVKENPVKKDWLSVNQHFCQVMNQDWKTWMNMRGETLVKPKESFVFLSAYGRAKELGNEWLSD
jgi:hypothetical protein